MYKRDHTPRRWGPLGRPEEFEPSPAGRRACRLSPEATQFLIDRLQGRNSKEAALILIEPDGDVRRGEAKVFDDWLTALKLSLDEGLYIYNTRTKRSSRAIWYAEPGDRTLANMSFEIVKLVPDKKTYDARIPRITTRLFALEE